MRRSYLLIAVLAMLAGVAAVSFLLRSTEAPVAPVEAKRATGAKSPERVAAPGVVEAASEEVSVGAEMAGLLTRVDVEEGDHVARGQVIARLDASLAREHVAAAEAQVKLREADLSAVRNGANMLQRTEAWVKYKEAQTGVEQARAEYERRQKLFDEGALSKEEVERAASNLTAARQLEEEANFQRRVVAAPAVDTDRKRAEAALAAAQAELDEARTLLGKTSIRAPLAGVVVHKFLKAGEMAGTGPILTIADTSLLRVRAEIDEADVGSVRVDEQAYVTAPAYGDRQFAGRVVRIAGALGRKKVSTGEPSERVDTRVLEALIQLKPGTALPLGLRVTCFIQGGA